MGRRMRHGGIVAAGVLVATVLVAAGVYLPASDWWTQQTVRRTIHEALATARPTAGRLSGIPYSRHSEDVISSTEFDRAALAILTLPPDSPQTIRLQAYLDIATHQWAAAAGRLEVLLNVYPESPDLLNDLGVVYVEMSRDQAFYLADALSLFERAATDPSATEPLFNLGLTYQLLHLTRDARAATLRFKNVARDIRWIDELEETKHSDDRRLLQTALEDQDSKLARSVMKRSPDALWRIVLGFGLNPTEGPSSMRRQLSRALRESDPPLDATLAAIVDPLDSAEGELVAAVRREILRTADGYVQDVEGSVRTFRQLSERTAGMHSPFDQLWVDLIHAEAMIWTGDSDDLDQAQQLLESATETASELDFKWVKAYALTMLGSHPHLSADRVEAIGRLEEAIELYEQIGAFTETVRPRLLLALYLVREGSHRESFGYAQAALGLTDSDDHRRLYPIYWAMSQNPLFKDSSLALSYPKEAAEQAKSANLGPGEIEVFVALAELHERSGRTALANQYLGRAEEVLTKIEPIERDLIDRAFLLGKARILTNRGQSSEAEDLLLEGLARLEREDVDVEYLQRYHLALGHLYSADGRFFDARSQYRQAVAAVEQEDDQIGASGRLFFDSERRDVYESAIAFELDHGDPERALDFAQGYRAKVIADSMGPFHTLAAASMSDIDTLDLEGLGNGRAVEYTVLPDRIVFWIFSENGIKHRSVRVEREKLEADVGQFLDLLSEPSEGPKLRALSESLHQILIAPVRDLLDEAEWLAIIPDRTLHRLPFGALRAPDGRYLIETDRITQTLDIRYFLIKVEESGGAQKLVAFGSQAVDTGVRRELRELRRNLPQVSVLDGFDVTKASVLDEGEGAGLLIYAGHAAYDRANSRTSAIQLDGRAGSDNAISAAEIAGMNLAPNALVVLSSCDSSIGNSIGGIEYRGLTSAFLAAGAGSVVGSLWMVDTNATADLMGYFYENLAAGDAAAEAIRKAQIALMVKYPHPYYWSSFTLTGNRSGLETPPFATGPSLRAAATPFQ